MLPSGTIVLRFCVRLRSLEASPSRTGPAVVRCTACQSDNREGRRFCASCGAALAIACRRCGYPNEAADRFGGGCGRSVDDNDAKAAREREGDRRPVAIMFCDIVGYTRLSSRLDAEEVHALLERFFAIVDAAVDRYGGAIDKHMGDAAMALFGAPRAHGDDALRAIRAALEIQASIPTVLTIDSRPLAVHVGIAMGGGRRGRRRQRLAPRLYGDGRRGQCRRAAFGSGGRRRDARVGGSL